MGDNATHRRDLAWSAMQAAQRGETARVVELAREVEALARADWDAGIRTIWPPARVRWTIEHRSASQRERADER